MCVCVCDIIHREGPALVTSGHTQVKCQKSENCVYCACVSVAASVYFPFLAIQFQVASLFIYYCTRTRVAVAFVAVAASLLLQLQLLA